MKLTYPAVFYPWDDGKGFTVEVPNLPGCTTEGSDMAEAIDMAIDAASGWVLDELEDGKAPPAASRPQDIRPDEDIGQGGFVSVIALDMDTYAEKYGKKAVRKNLTIPAWLNTFAEERHINFSRVLQNSLTELYQKERAVV
jgi:predicted RNase H-like HicB family nuclease